MAGAAKTKARAPISPLIREVSTTWPFPVFSRAKRAAVNPQAYIRPSISSPMPGRIWPGGSPGPPTARFLTTLNPEVTAFSVITLVEILVGLDKEAAATA